MPAGYGNVEGATAQAGKDLFETLGCQGCHTTAPDERRPGPFATRERDVAPNLSNIGLKTNADWLIAPGTAQENIALLVELLTHIDRQPPVAPAASP